MMDRANLLAFCAATALACLPSQGLACTLIQPASPPTQEQKDAWLRESFVKADDLVDIVLLTSVTDFKPGRARVQHSYKGRHRKGAIIKVATTGGSMCGPGDAKPKQQLTLRLGDKEPHHMGWQMSLQDVDKLAKWGLLKKR